ncbi:MAG TPA: pentapeptide repeat-containing protein, partial [Hyphomicrobiales bacterium]|nr:pentapeptide repeat-containing protein [Hyphomicrobiales bacterium]
RNADLRYARFVPQQSGGRAYNAINLRGADLRGANLTGAVLIGVDMRDALLEGTILKDAQMSVDQKAYAEQQGARF